MSMQMAGSASIVIFPPGPIEFPENAMTASAPSDAGATPQERGSVGEVFAAFLKLGVMSFGGPIAHLGYFREELVVRRRWLDEAAYADLVALCQFLPGPASSQVGFSLGVLRGNGFSERRTR
jgi:chromate transporter